MTSRNRELLTVGEVADELKVKAATVRRWINEDKLRAARLAGGTEFRVLRGDLDAMLGLEPEAVAPAERTRRPFAATAGQIKVQ